MVVKLKIKKGDKVVVTTGRDKGKSGEVLAVFPSENRALVQGVNMVKRHQKQTAQSEGGIINREGKIHISIWPWLTRKTVSQVVLVSRLMMTARKRASPNVREK